MFHVERWQNRLAADIYNAMRDGTEMVFSHVEICWIGVRFPFVSQYVPRGTLHLVSSFSIIYKTKQL